MPEGGADASEQPTEMIPATAERPVVPEGEPATAVQGPAAEAAPATADQGPAADAAPAEQAPARDLPAGVDPGELEVAPAPSARRGKLRRRLRYLRRVRELLLRDLGGFTYEVHRTAGGSLRESHRRLAEAKAGRLTALDAEVRELEGRLSEPHVEPVLREPGIGGTCPECGELHASDAHYCSRCGAPLDAKARAAREAAIRAAAQPTTGAHPTPEPKPASVLWAAGPRPRAQTPSAESGEAAQPKWSMATSEWLAVPRKPAAAGSTSAEVDAAEPTRAEAQTAPPADEAAGDEGQAPADEAARAEAQT
ncbi:MAG: zinc-ribbon domain-containing protein, partial [Solirubrobacteraceae bacterium]